MKKKIETIRIESIADKGMALGRLDGKAAFIPFAAPGDLAEIEIVKDKKRHIEGRIVRLIEPSPFRRRAPCPQFGKCGGCQWQHIAYDRQLEAKTKSIKGYFLHRLGMGMENIFGPSIASPVHWGYRNKICLKVKALDNGSAAGFFAAGSHELIPAPVCSIAHKEIQKILSPLQAFVKETNAADKLALSGIDLQVDGESRLWASLHMGRQPSIQDCNLLKEFFRKHLVAGTSAFIGAKKSTFHIQGAQDKITYSVKAMGKNLTLEAGVGQFVQANFEINQLLINEVMAMAGLFKGKTVLDLYCGSGNFTLPLALEAGKIAAVEGNRQAIFDLENNARMNNLNNVMAYPLSARRGLEKLAAENFKPDLILLDPPRQGAAEAAPPLAEMSPEHIIYISCSHATLVRDLNTFVQNGYEIQSVKLADMFPQTSHMESISVLKKTKQL